jgi:site-specific DNA recombinase
VLGYDLDPAGRRLVVNEEEAERVRAIFTLFEENLSLLLTLAEIERRGCRRVDRLALSSANTPDTHS